MQQQQRRQRRRRARGTWGTALEGLEQRRLLAVSSIVFPGPDGRLVYVSQADGDRIPDFSMVGYQGGTVPLPDTPGGVVVPVKQTLNPGAPGVDMHTTIQNAINAVAALTPDANGFRGAIQLTAGNYPISGTLNINASGIVLIGAGNDKNTGTRLEAIGTTATDARILISISGSGSRSTVSGTTHNIQNYVPVGATSFTVDSTTNLHVGDTVIVHRPSTTNWLHDIGMDLLTNPWTAGQRDINSDRTITAINGNTITIDAPLTNSLDPQYGGGTIFRYTWSGRISQVGLMNMYTYSDYVGSNVPGTPDTDTTHATGIASLDNCLNCWVENLTADNFATNILNLGGNTKSTTIDHVTIQNTSQAQSNIDDAPSGIGGTQGTLNLCENITLTNAYHAISAGGNVAGPNVYTNITITDPLEGALNLPHSRDETGPHQRYSTGGLFDDVSNTDWVNIRNAGNEGSGHGWQGANYVLWNVNARTDVSSPPTAQNWVIGGSASTSEGTAIYDQRGQTMFPLSLYATQLWDRTHPNPTIATAAAASPNPRSSNTTTLSVLGADAAPDVGEAGLKYTWSVASKPNGAADPTFSANGTNAAKNSVATFSAAGTYVLTVTISDAGGLLATSNVIVTDRPTTAINGDADFANENDTIVVKRNGSFTDVTRNNVLVLHQDYASSPELAVEGLGGSDTIIVDYSAGNPVPANGLFIDGGGGGNDVVSVVGGSGGDAVTLGTGSVSVNGGSFGYAGVEELDLNLGAGTDTLTASGNGSVAAPVFVVNVSGGGSLAITGGSVLPTFTDVNVSAGTTFDLGGNNETIDSLNGAGTVTDNGAAATLGVNNGTFSGGITNGSGTLSLAKNSAGKLILSGNNGYSGNTTINGGAIESGNSQSLALLAGAVVFNGGTFHVTADTVSANVANKYTTSFSGATSSATAVFDIDAGVTLTIGTAGGSACLRTNGGGGHGGDFTKTGAGTLKILSNNGQQDNVFHLAQGTVDLESATGLGGGDAGVRLDASSGTTLILKTDVATNFLTPLNLATAGGSVTVILDRLMLGAGVADALNALTSVGAFTLNVFAGPNVNSAIAGLTLGSVTLGGNGLFNVLSSGAGVAAVTVTGAVSGAFAVSKSSGGALILAGSNSYTGATSVNGGTLEVDGSIASSSGVTVASGATFLAASTQTLVALTINSGGQAQALAGANKVLTVDALSISGSGALDLADNDLIYDYSTASPLATVQALLASGYSGSTWVGAGIRSSAAAAAPGHSTGLGFGEASTLGITSFDGQSVDSTAILVRYTAAADANLDGTADTIDFNALAGHFGSAGQTWITGDFNYDAVVDTLDFNALAAAFGQTVPAPARALIAVAAPPAPLATRPASFSDVVIDSKTLDEDLGI